jgi:hypothetical protein
MPARSRSAKAQRSKPVAIVLHDVPPTYDWGWFSREDPRMHLQNVDKDHKHLHYKVWMEDKGKRVVHAEPGIPAKVLKALRNEIAKQRERIETYWLIFMMKNDWIKVQVAGSQVTIVCYPQFPTRFTRTINLHDYIGNSEVVGKVKPGDVALNMKYGLLEIFPKLAEPLRHHIDLPPIIWT